MKSLKQLEAALEFLLAEDAKQNEGKPEDHLHRQHFLPTCNTCSAIVTLLWVLERTDPHSGLVREFPYITEDERTRLLAEADKYMHKKLPPSATVNTW